MNKITLLFLIFSLSFNSFSQSVLPIESGGSPYFNLREGNSSIINSTNKDEVKEVVNDSSMMLTLHKIILDKSINSCASKVVNKITQSFNFSEDKDVELSILALRLANDLDDISTGILLKSLGTKKIVSIPISQNELSSTEEDKAFSIYRSVNSDFKNTSLCLEDVYRNLVSKLFIGSPKFVKNLKHLNRSALKNNVISKSMFQSLEYLRMNKVHEWPLTLSDYKNRLENISIKFPFRLKESADLVTNVKFNEKKSLRQSVYEKYDSNQVLILANIVKDLKKRLDSKDITITINYVDQESEVINLSAMEKFRFILKLLRKELAIINNSSMFAGAPATYMDIITASYEVGYISANEITMLASLQDIWNPTKTTKEKVMFWTKNFGSVASAFLPPPFGFVAVMAIMLIDQRNSEAPVNRDSDFNLL
ncbi:MAG: hypothetical protein Q7U04_18185 [Bacteriovorax sp.]|nr:hypothetical protein [Bacteriovorax sp.]